MGLYTFPLQHYARTVIGYGNSVNPKNPVKYKAAISFMRASRAEWNDDTWTRDRFTYPYEALESGAIGRVTAQFTIDMFDNLEDAKVLRGLYPAIDSAVLSHISSSPKWTPALDIAGNPYSLTYTFPVIITPEMINEARSL